MRKILKIVERAVPEDNPWLLTFNREKGHVALRLPQLKGQFNFTEGNVRSLLRFLLSGKTKEEVSKILEGLK